MLSNHLILPALGRLKSKAGPSSSSLPSGLLWKARPLIFNEKDHTEGCYLDSANGWGGALPAGAQVLAGTLPRHSTKVWSNE